MKASERTLSAYNDKVYSTNVSQYEAQLIAIQAALRSKVSDGTIKQFAETFLQDIVNIESKTTSKIFNGINNNDLYQYLPNIIMYLNNHGPKQLIGPHFLYNAHQTLTALLTEQSRKALEAHEMSIIHKTRQEDGTIQLEKKMIKSIEDINDIQNITTEQKNYLKISINDRGVWSAGEISQSPAFNLTIDDTTGVSQVTFKVSKSNNADQEFAIEHDISNMLNNDPHLQPMTYFESHNTVVPQRITQYVFDFSASSALDLHEKNYYNDGWSELSAKSLKGIAAQTCLDKFTASITDESSEKEVKDKLIIALQPLCRTYKHLDDLNNAINSVAEFPNPKSNKFMEIVYNIIENVFGIALERTVLKVIAAQIDEGKTFVGKVIDKRSERQSMEQAK